MVVPGYLLDTLALYSCFTYSVSFSLCNNPRYCPERWAELFSLPLRSTLYLSPPCSVPWEADYLNGFPCPLASSWVKSVGADGRRAGDRVKLGYFFSLCGWRRPAAPVLQLLVLAPG